MSFKAHYKIKKSKNVYCIPISRNSISHEHLESQQTRVKLTVERQGHHHSNNKIQTINFKKYNHQKKIQLEKRKQSHKPLNLFLDGAQPPTISYQDEKNKRKSPKNGPFQNQQSSKLVEYNSYNSPTSRKTLPAQKNLRNLILKEINLKGLNKPLKRQSNHINNLSFQAIEGLCILKKINRMAKQRIEQKKQLRSIQMQKLRNISSKQFQSPYMDNSAKFSIFSQRTPSNTKTKSVLKMKNYSNFTLNKTQRSVPQNWLPSVEVKNKRPLVALQTHEDKRILSQSYIVVKYPQSMIISGLNYKINAEIASLTKIMTFYTILFICQQYSINYKTKYVEICQFAQQMSGTSAQLFEGEKYTLEQLFYGLMLPSGNDAAIAIAQQGGRILKQFKNKKIFNDQSNIKCFVKYMNVLAKDIKMKFSNFANPHGLSHPENVSNPFQITLLISQCLKFTQFLQVTGTKVYRFYIGINKNKREIKWENTNKLLRRSQFIGGKTGVTSTAGPCLATVFKSNSGQIFITVVLRAPKLSRRFKQTRWILGFTLNKLNNKKYQKQSSNLLQQNAQLQSDNSSDEQHFDFNKCDSTEIKKRNKILLYQM